MSDKECDNCSQTEQECDCGFETVQILCKVHDSCLARCEIFKAEITLIKQESEDWQTQYEAEGLCLAGVCTENYQLKDEITLLKKELEQARIWLHFSRELLSKLNKAPKTVKNIDNYLQNQRQQNQED